MPKKDKNKSKSKQKKKDKKAQKAAEKEAAAAAKSEEFKAESGKGDKDAKADSKKDAKGGKKAAKGKAPDNKKGAGKDKEAAKEEQYVSPFSDNVDEHGFGFGDQATDLADLEHMLNVEVDEDFFVEPRFFHTLRRVINVLGIHVADDAKEDLTGKQLLERNPAYQNLQKQAGVVEEAINRMSETYCNALNRSVIQVGRIAREFDDAIQKVESLRSQVRAIQETIGARTSDGNRPGANQTATGNDEEGTGGQRNVAAVTPASQMSLRELWMLKLESEAMLSLIGKLNIVRDAPGRFDDLTATSGGTSSRIGAATQCLTVALQTMFSDEMSQIQALEQILENLMMRKATAEEIIWETLEDVLYLKTSNGHILKFEVRDEKQQQKEKLQQKLTEGMTTIKNKNVPKPGEKAYAADTTKQEISKQIYNPFQKNYMLLCVEDALETDDVSINSQGSEEAEEADDADEKKSTHNKKESMHMRTQSTASENSFGEDSVNADGRKKRRMMIPKEVVESDLDLAADEMKCFDYETKALSKVTMQQRYLPRYKDPVLSLRILVDCLARIGRLHKAEEMLMKSVEAEIKGVFQLQQARTFYRLDRRKPSVTNTIRANAKDADELKDFRRHFTAVLSCFGCIMMRYSYLAQIARSKLMADEELRASVKEPSTFMRSVLEKAYSVMNSELINFLRACLQEHLSKGKAADAKTTEQSLEKQKIFSFGVLEAEGEEQKTEDEAKADKKQEQKPEPEPEAKPEEEAEKDAAPIFTDMPANAFVSSVLFPMTNTTPQIQHALIFRRSIDRFTKINEAREKELSLASAESNTVPRRKPGDELAVEFLDKAIRDNVIPFIVREAINGCITAIDQEDAFDPPVEANVYARADKIQPLDVAMVLACQDVMNNTQPLFLAIHRLPPGEHDYGECVNILTFCMENLVRGVEEKVAKMCEGTTSDELLEGLGDDKGKLSAAFGKRSAFVELLKAYEFDLDLMDEVEILGIEDTVAAKSFDTEGTPEKGGKPIKHGSDGLPEKGIERDEALFKQEIELMKEYLDYLPYHQESLDYDVLTRGGLKEATCFAHSLLKISSMLEDLITSQVKGSKRLLPGVEALHANIKKVKAWGIKMAKFCHTELVLQVVYKMSKVCNSTTLCAPDSVRIPSSVNAVAEWLVGTMDYLREATSNAMAAYAYSNLGQYLPSCLMSTVRVIAAGEGIILKAPLTMNGIESLDRSAAVLYKDLKASTGFQSKFFNIQLTALNFEKAATFTALMEMSIEELAEYYTTHSQSEEFSDEDYELMFGMDGPRRRGDDKQFKKLKNVIKKRKKEKEEKKEAGQQATT